MFLQCVNDEFDVVCDDLRLSLLFEVVRPHEHHNARRIEVQHVSVQANEHPAGRIAADASIGNFQARKRAVQIIAPALGDRVSQKHDGLLILFDLLRPC